MAMLAEPRRFRKRYNLVPRGKALFEDDNRFGTKMLERMGWSKGKGLGAREDGSQEFVRVRYKNDANGIGYEDRDDQWTQHEEQFNGLLNSLNNSESNSEVEGKTIETVGFGFASTSKDNKNVKNKISGESLEEKSKKSKARVHYKKFTKGKDLSQYSEKDLANIFGKKTNEDTSFQNFEEIIIDPTEGFEESESNTETNKFGITTINTGTSVNDYFKQKMEEIKKRRMQNSSKNILDTTENIDNQSNVVEKTKKKKKNSILDITLEENVCKNTDHDKLEICKKKKRKHVDIIEPPVKYIEETPVKSFEEVSPPKKKKRKLEILVNNEELLSETLNAEVAENLEEKYKKKKKKLKIPTINKELPIENLEEIFTKRSKHKKKKIKISVNKDEESNTEELEIFVNKKINNKNLDLNIQTPEVIENTEFIKCEKKKKCRLPPPELSVDFQITEHSKLKQTTDAGSPKYPVSDPTTNSIIISEFCAEKFRHTDINRFPGSNLGEIQGYGLGKDLKMEIVHFSTDMESITKLWTKVFDNSLTDKYELHHKCPLRKFAKEMREARKNKKKTPKINIKRFKNKSVFRTI